MTKLLSERLRSRVKLNTAESCVDSPAHHWIIETPTIASGKNPLGRCKKCGKVARFRNALYDEGVNSWSKAGVRKSFTLRHKKSN